MTMSEREYSCPMLRDATKNEDGDLTYEREYTGPAGENRRQEVNVTAIYSPGRRKSSDVDLLLLEAELAADGKDLGNPAFPTSEDVATQVHDRLPEDVRPAWIECTPKEFP